MALAGTGAIQTRTSQGAQLARRNTPRHPWPCRQRCSIVHGDAKAWAGGLARLTTGAYLCGDCRHPGAGCRRTRLAGCCSSGLGGRSCQPGADWEPRVQPKEPWTAPVTAPCHPSSFRATTYNNNCGPSVLLSQWGCLTGPVCAVGACMIAQGTQCVGMIQRTFCGGFTISIEEPQAARHGPTHARHCRHIGAFFPGPVRSSPCCHNGACRNHAESPLQRRLPR